MKTQRALPSWRAANRLSTPKNKSCAHPPALSRGRSTADTAGGMLPAVNLGTAAPCRHRQHSSAQGQGALQGPKDEVDAPARGGGCCSRMLGDAAGMAGASPRIPN